MGDYFRKLLEDVKTKIKDEKLGLKMNIDNEVAKLKSGKEAESKVRQIVDTHFPGNDMIDDLYFDLSDYYTSIEGYRATMQIDHCYPSEHYIALIETKSYCESAEISGAPLNKKWSYKDDTVKKTTRENAIKQNNYHIYNFKRILDLGDETDIVSIICLDGIKPENIKVSMPYGTHVVMVDDLPYLLSFLDNTYKNKTINRNKLIQEINNKTIKDCATEIEHIIYVKLLSKKIRNTKKGKRRRK